MSLNFITPNWPAPKNIRAYTTTRSGGVSQAPYDSFNLAAHGGDDLEAVQKNRALLKETLNLPNEPAWLSQNHTTIAVEITANYQKQEADASFAREANQVCVVMTADCLPLLVCNQAGTEIAAIHAGWRGLADGVIEATIKKLNSDPKDLLVWLGPAMGPAHYQVGSDTRDAFLKHDPKAESGFYQQDATHWLLDMYHIARQRLHALGITAIYGGGHCTYTEQDKFFSYRRAAKTGRMATLIWRQ